MTSSLCPRCASPREQRDGPYYVCVDCHWCWTVSITGRIYVEGYWPRPAQPTDAYDPNRCAQRLLASVEGLSERLALPWPTPPAEDRLWRFSPDEVQRLRHARDATAAHYFNEGVPLAQLRDEGIWLPPEDSH